MFLTDAELNASLVDVVSTTPAFYVDAQLYFSVLLKTGCRPIEVYEVERWRRLDAESFAVQCAKGQGERVLPQSLLPVGFVHMVDRETPLKWLSTVRSFRYAFQKSYMFLLPSKGLKYSELYLFRYNAFKQKYSETGSEIAVKEYFIESSLIVTQGYIYAAISVE